MFAKFNLQVKEFFYHNVINYFSEEGHKIYDTQKKEVEDSLSPFIKDNGVIDGSALKSNWFAIKKKDVFISHSHQDINKVKAFAGWLKVEFGLDSFIDSCAWGYCDELLKKLDNKYCLNSDKKTYDYNLRNYTTSHIHIMLSAALTEMIDKTECIIFYNTPQSIILSDEFYDIRQNNKNAKTTSPWIYHELLMTTMLTKKKPVRQSSVTEGVNIRHNFSDNLSIEYDVEKALDNMVTLDAQILEKWLSMHNNISHSEKHSLDILYQITAKNY